MQQTYQAGADSPPPYEPAPSEQPLEYDGKSSAGNKPLAAQLSPRPPTMIAGPSYIPQQHGACSPTVYHYVNPKTGEHVTSLLPPDHPEMICLQEGQHVTETKYGLLGVLAAIFWFPLGTGLCLLDRRVRCRRCGIAIQDGMCGL